MGQYSNKHKHLFFIKSIKGIIKIHVKDTSIISMEDDRICKYDFAGIKIVEFFVSNNYLFVWDNFIHLNSLKFINTELFQEIILSETNLNIELEAITFVAKNKNEAIFKSLNLQSQNIEFFLINNLFEIKLLDESVERPVIINDNVIVCNYNNVITAHEKNGGLMMWNVRTQDILGSSENNILGNELEYNGLLYCSLSDNIDKKGIFAIDIETGQVVNRTCDVVGWMKLANDKIFIVKDARWVIVLDPLSLQYEKIDCNPLLSPFGLNLGRRHLEVIVNNHLYFVSESIRGGSEATVGIIDISKKELLWYTPIPIEEGSYWVKEIQVHEDRLFVLTQGGTLHIFGNE